MVTWSTQTRKIRDLKAYHKNPRKLTKDQFDQLKSSLDKFDYVEIAAINTDNTILAGHMRLKVLEKIHGKNHEIDVRVPDRKLTPIEQEEYVIRSNKNTGEWDFDILANDFEVANLVEWGFPPEEIEMEVEEIESEDEDEQDGCLSPTTDPKTKLGDIYILGNHRLMCGDSTNPDHVLALLNEQEPILMVTDPPYGVNYDASWRKDIKGKEEVAARALGKVQNDDKADWSVAWSLFPGSVAYAWCASLHVGEVQKSFEDADFEMVSLIIWAKQHFALSRGDYHWKHEPCWYAVKKGHAHNWQGSRKECTIWEISNFNAFGGKKEDGEERTAHSTQKPMECMAKPIRNNTAEGEGVYDPFCGSGTTLIACEQHNRIAFCMELDPAYCDIIVSRWIKYRKKLGKDYKVILNSNEIEWNGTKD